MIGRTPVRNSELGRWITENMPELDRELGPLSLDDVRKRLNEITGLDIPGSASKSDATEHFLEALKAKHKETACK